MVQGSRGWIDMYNCSMTNQSSIVLSSRKGLYVLLATQLHSFQLGEIGRFVFHRADFNVSIFICLQS